VRRIEMEIDVGTWVESYARAWEEVDAEAAAMLFAEHATYRSFIFDEPHVGRDGVRAYWSDVTSTQSDVQVRMGRPIVEGHRAAVEFWTNMQNEGADITLVGCLLLIFDDEGRCQSLDEYYELAQGRIEPPETWGAR
jgi:hypothetical protein